MLKKGMALMTEDDFRDRLRFFHKLSPRQSEYVLALLQDLTEE